ncbi:MAG: cytochrome b/b6 domain-containing protein [Magnetovibrio sp.]|nr:cytochrome b/b6 domain-containing protein [Magnetovibrio sp.]
MADDENTAQTSPTATTTTHVITVWDLPIRLFHLALVAVVLVAYLSAYVLPENALGLHLWSGYVTVALLVFRLTWGWLGSHYSRLQSFAYSPAHILKHLQELATLRPVTHYIGHNPSGALMVFALLMVLSIITVSGLMVLGGEENQGPLAGIISYAVAEHAATVHNVIVLLLLAMVVLHIAGVLLETKLTGQRLVRAMFNGRKTVPLSTPSLPLRPARPVTAAAVLTVFITIAGSVLWALSTMPASGLITLPANTAYEGECGDCHSAFHPSLMPIASWAKVMGGLDDHFGEDASLDAETVTDITSYLTQYGGEKWDTEASNRFAILNPAKPLRITATPYWLRKHSAIAPAQFKLKSVGGKTNCGGCHRDQQSGRFDDQNIQIPKE